MIRSSPNQNIKTFGTFGVSIVAAVQVVALNMVYNQFAVDLNDAENHRRETDHEDSLIAKLFVFTFINSYASLFYIAFVKTLVGQRLEGDPSVMVELATQLSTVLVTQLTVGKVMAYVEYVVYAEIRRRHEAADYVKAQQEEDDIAKSEGRESVKLPEPSVLEKEYSLPTYDISSEMIQDYSQIVTQYGFVTLFVAACPIAPLLAYGGNLIELRLDAYKFLYVHNRVIPMGAEDILTWMDALQIVSYIAVMTNSALICFSMEVIQLSLIYKLWIFFFLQYSILFAMYIFDRVVDDVPEDVSIQIGRQHFLRNRALMEEDELYKVQNKRSFRKDAMIQPENLLNKHIHRQDYVM